MDGKSAREFTKRLIRAAGVRDIVNDHLTYQLLDAGTIEFCDRVGCVKDSQDITTVADQASYDLSADYIRLYLRDDDKRGGNFFVKYTDTSSNVYMITFEPYQEVYFANQTTSVSLPSNFTIHEKTSLPSQLTGIVTTAGALSGGQATLTDSTATFLTSTTYNVYERDIVHNTTKNAYGIVLSVSSSVALVTAIFTEDGNPAAWQVGDAYVIQPMVRLQLQLDPPPDTAAETVTVPYIAKSPPVYSDFCTWRFSDIYHPALCYYAAWLYLTQYEIADAPQGGGLQVTLGEKYYKMFDMAARKARREHDTALGRTGYSKRSKV